MLFFSFFFFAFSTLCILFLIIAHIKTHFSDLRKKPRTVSSHRSWSALLCKLFPRTIRPHGIIQNLRLGVCRVLKRGKALRVRRREFEILKERRAPKPDLDMRSELEQKITSDLSQKVNFLVRNRAQQKSGASERIDRTSEVLYSRKFSSAKNSVKSDRRAVRQEFIFVRRWSTSFGRRSLALRFSSHSRMFVAHTFGFGKKF